MFFKIYKLEKKIIKNNVVRTFSSQHKGLVEIVPIITFIGSNVIHWNHINTPITFRLKVMVHNHTNSYRVKRHEISTLFFILYKKMKLNIPNKSTKEPIKAFVEIERFRLCWTNIQLSVTIDRAKVCNYPFQSLIWILFHIISKWYLYWFYPCKIPRRRWYLTLV